MEGMRHPGRATQPIIMQGKTMMLKTTLGRTLGKAMLGQTTQDKIQETHIKVKEIHIKVKEPHIKAMVTKTSVVKLMNTKAVVMQITDVGSRSLVFLLFVRKG